MQVTSTLHASVQKGEPERIGTMGRRFIDDISSYYEDFIGIFTGPETGSANFGICFSQREARDAGVFGVFDRGT